jgi:predicted amidohydrolase
MRVLAIQLHTTAGEVAANYDRAYRLLEQGAELYRPDVIMLPEAFAAYAAAADMRPYGEDVPGPTAQRFCDYSRHYDAMILYGLVRRDPLGRGLFNSVVVVDRGELIGIYDKTHLVMGDRPAELDERAIFVQGDRLGVFDTRFGRIGVLVCHDGVYPEIWRALALEGARAIFWLVNDGDMSAWGKAHAFWNLTPIFSCNRVTKGPNGKRKGGGSFIADVHGEFLDLAGTAEGFVFAEVDLDEQARYRAEGRDLWSNFYRVRRPDLYGSLVRPIERSDAPT